MLYQHEGAMLYTNVVLLYLYGSYTSLELIYVLHLKLKPSGPWNSASSLHRQVTGKDTALDTVRRLVDLLAGWHICQMYTPWKIKSKISTWILDEILLTFF